jgi:hypothetical protein
MRHRKALLIGNAVLLLLLITAAQSVVSLRSSNDAIALLGVDATPATVDPTSSDARGRASKWPFMSKTVEFANDMLALVVKACASAVLCL